MNKRVVMKFGGKSVDSPEKLHLIAIQAIKKHQEGHSVLVVVSAQGDMTDRLEKRMRAVSPSAGAREKDRLLAVGELITIELLTAAIHRQGGEAISLTGPEAGIITDGVFGKAAIICIYTTRIEEEWKKGNIVVVAGFQGISKEGELTTLGRGGSDTSAVYLAVALQANCELGKDVPGVQTADPKIVPSARTLKSIPYEKMLELARTGSGIVHGPAVEAAGRNGVRILIRPTFGPGEGTVIGETPLLEEASLIKISCDTSVKGFSASGKGEIEEFLRAIEDNGINLEDFFQSKDENGWKMSFTVSLKDAPKVIPASFSTKQPASFSCMPLTFDEGIMRISLIGSSITNQTGVARRMEGVIRESGGQLHFTTTSRISITAIVSPLFRLKEIAQALHNEFNE